MFKYSIDGSIVPDNNNKEKVMTNSNLAEYVYNADGNFSCVNKETFYAPGDPTTAPTTAATTTAPTTAATTTTTPSVTTAPTTAVATTTTPSVTIAPKKPISILNVLPATLNEISKTEVKAPTDGNAWVPLLIVSVLALIFLSIAHFGNIPTSKP
jgi:hypothetical protein